MVSAIRYSSNQLETKLFEENPPLTEIYYSLPTCVMHPNKGWILQGSIHRLGLLPGTTPPQGATGTNACLLTISRGNFILYLYF